MYDSLDIYTHLIEEVTNIIEILQIIEKAKVLHLALFDADYMNCTDRCRYMV